MSIRDRHLIRLASIAVCPLVWSGTAAGHDGIGHGGAPVTFPVVLCVPIITGLLGGIVAIRCRYGRIINMDHHRMSSAFGLLLIVLSGVSGITALTKRPLLGCGVGCFGALAAVCIGRGDGGQLSSRGHDAILTLGSVCAHRLLEGVALGALYTVSASVGVVGVTVIAAHTALETAAVGGLFTSRVQLVAAILLVQIGYVLGAITGVSVSVSVPVSVQVASIGLLAGILLVVGVEEIRHTSIAIDSGDSV